MDDTVNASQAAQLVGVSERTMRAWLAGHKIADARKTHLPGGPAQWEIPLTSLEGLTPLSRRSSARDGFETARIADLERQLRSLDAQLQALTTRNGNLMRSRGRAGAWGLSEGADYPPAMSDGADELADASYAPAYAPRDRARTVTRALHSTTALPDGLIPWREFAELHGISTSTVKDAIERGKLPIVQGNWKVERFYIKGALDAEGRRQFFRLWGHRPDYRPCIECPHTITPSMGSVDGADGARDGDA
jgi:hypothetical protein